MFKKPKIVWETIHRILKPNSKAITASPDTLNIFFSGIAENLTGKSPESIQKTNLPGQIDNICQLKEVYYNDIQKELKNIRNFCSTGFDGISAALIKPVAIYLSSPLTHIISNCTKLRCFPRLWKIAKNMSNAKTESAPGFMFNAIWLP